MLCYSTGSLPDHFSFPQILDAFMPTAFYGVELVLTPAMLEKSFEKEYWTKIRSEFGSAGFEFRNIHLGAPNLLSSVAHQPGLSSLNLNERNHKITAAQQALAIATYLGSPHVTVTTGLPEVTGTGGEGKANVEPEVEVEVEQIKALHHSLNEIVAFKKNFLSINFEPEDSIAILIEQEPEHVIRSTDQLLSLCKKFKGNVFANFDVGHSHVLAEDIGASIQKLGTYLKNIHLEDISGRVHQHKLFGEGDVDFDAVFESLKAIGYLGDYTPDLYPFKEDYKKVMPISEKFLKDRGIF